MANALMQTGSHVRRLVHSRVGFPTAACVAAGLYVFGLVAVQPAIAQGTVALDSSAANRLSVAGRDFDPLSNAASFGSAALDPLGRGLRLVQWKQPLSQSDLDRLQAAGAQPLQYYPNQAYLVWSDSSALEQVSADTGVRWVGDFGSDLKQSPELRGRSGLIDLVDVHFLANGSPQGVLQALAALGAEVVAYAPAQPDRRIYDAFVRVDGALLPGLANLPEVIWLGYQSPRAVAEDEITAQVVVGNAPNGSTPAPGYLNYLNGLGLSGNGVVWGVSDDGVDLRHPEFVGRFASGYSFPGCLAGNGPGDDGGGGGHGTHVAGILGGFGVSGFTDPQQFLYGLGLAPQVQLYAQNVLCPGGTPSFPPEGGWQSLSRRAHAAGAVGTNASFTTGEGLRHGYQAIERLFDFMIRDADFDNVVDTEPLAIVFSAGNSGPLVSSLTAPKEAKNAIVVGATESPRAGDATRILNGSSRGPAQDGRIIPTVVAPGQSISSSRRLGGGSLCNQPVIPDTDQLYAYCSGTSMAAPHVSGLAALLVQWWRLQFDGSDPSPAMIKALLIEGAEPTDNLLTPVPNPNEGWGRAMLSSLVRENRPPWAIDQSRILTDNGQTDRFVFVPVDAALPVRVVLTWTDAPAAVGAIPALVNDLDLQVQRGATHYAGNQGAMGGPADRLNNAEVVYLPADPAPLVVRVKAHHLPGDGVPYVGDATDQDYALLCHNCKPVPGFDLAAGTTTNSICAGQQTLYSLPITELDAGLGAVSASLLSVPSGISATLMPGSLAGDGAFAIQISGTAGLTTGDYQIDVGLQAAGFDLAQSLSLQVVQSAPQNIVLAGPLAAAEVSNLRPTLRWNPLAQADRHHLQVSYNSDFSAPLVDLELAGTSYTFDQDLVAESMIYWRVWGINSCGAGVATPATFRTPATPGSCPAGTRKLLIYRDDLEPAQDGWQPVSGGVNTWQLSSQRAQSPTRSWKAFGLGSVSDQGLDSPLIVLPPASERPTLSFSHWRSIEGRTGSICWDGAVVDLLPSNGSAIAAKLDEFQSGAPQRVLSASSPSPGRPAWCGESGFETTRLDLRAYANQSLRVRFRLLSDAGVAREGWYVDDLRIHSCIPVDQLFRSGMGAEPR